MTIDERIECLMQSTDRIDRQIGGTGKMATLTSKFDALGR